MTIAYHQPSLAHIYAQRTIYNGYKHAFTDLGHNFVTYSAGMDLRQFLEAHRPDIFMTAAHFLYRRQLDYQLLKDYRQQGLLLLTKIDFWQSPLSRNRINEAASLKDDKPVLRLIHEGLLGDVFHHVVEQNDPRMAGFKAGTGHDYVTIPLAADKTLSGHRSAKLRADISFVGTNLPEKRQYFRRWVYPLRSKYQVRLYGQDWTYGDRLLGWAQRFGQLFNLPQLSSIRKPSLGLSDEANVYASSTISINLHEEYQRHFGGDCNERTFKIPLYGGFEVTDDVAAIRRYFKPDEMVIASSQKEWFDAINHYLENPDERLPIMRAGYKRVLLDHTYHNRAKQIIGLRQAGHE